MSFEELQKAADGLGHDNPFADVKGPSHHIISLNNVGTLESKVLQIDFLSPVVSKKFSKRLWDESHVTARSMILLQMTTSGLYKGSQKGYLAQEIMEQIQQQRGPGQPSQAKKLDLKGKGRQKSHCRLR